MKKLAIAMTMVAAGCGGDPSMMGMPASQFIAGFNPPASTAGETVFISPVIKGIQPGSDTTLCSYLDAHFTDQTDVVKFRVFQSGSGHHALLYAAKRDRPIDTHVCTDDDMINTRLVAAGGSETGTVKALSTIPDGLAFRIPAGSQLMFQTHWINATSTVTDGQSTAYITTLPSSPSRQPLDLFNVLSTAFTIPAGAKSSVSTTCTIKHDVSAFSLTGHEHEFGSHVTIEIIDSGKSSTVWSHDWQPEYSSNSPANYYPIDHPFVFKAGQQVKLTCEWNNVTPNDIRFPREMCVSSSFYFPGHGEIDCEEGNWSE